MLRKFVAKYLSSARTESDSEAEGDGVEIAQTDGALMALVSRYPHVESLEGACVDARPLLLKERYQTSYERFDIDQMKIVTTNEGTWVVATIDVRACDFVNMLDLCIDNPGRFEPFEILDSIVVEYGGFKIDGLYTQQQLDINAALHDRSVTHLNGKTFVPIAIAPFHRTALAFPSTKDLKLRLKISFKKPYASDVDIYGRKYYIEGSERKKIRGGDHQYAIATTQYDPVSSTDIERGANSIDLSHLRGPAYALYFWGLDKSKIKNVRFELNGASFYDGPVEALEHAKANRGLGSVEPVVIFFSDREIEEESAADSAVNFSSILKKTLVIDTAESDAVMKVAAICFQSLEYSNRSIHINNFDP